MQNRDWIQTFLILNTVFTVAGFVFAASLMSTFSFTILQASFVLSPLVGVAGIWMTLAWWMYAKNKDESMSS